MYDVKPKVDTWLRRTPNKKKKSDKIKVDNDSFSQIVEKVQKTVINLPNSFAALVEKGKVVHRSDVLVDKKYYEKEENGIAVHRQDLEKKVAERVQAIEENIEKFFFLKEKNEIEQKMKNQNMRWISSLENLKMIQYAIENLNEVRSKDRKLYQLYSKLLDLPFFRNYSLKEAIVTFSAGRLKEMDKGELERYGDEPKVLILLRGGMIVGEKKTIKPEDLKKPIKDLDIFPSTKDGYSNIYFDLVDGDYVSPTVFKFFPEKEPGSNKLKDLINIRYSEDSLVLEILINEKIEMDMLAHKTGDFYKKIEYLAKHPCFENLSFDTLQMVSRRMYNRVFKYGDEVMLTGEEPENLYVIKSGTVTVRRFLNFLL
jgi:hypothetical protein